MKLEICSFELAKLLEDKGFPKFKGSLYGKSYYNHSGELNHEIKDYIKAVINKEDTSKFKIYSAPTLDLACKWLREEHQIHIELIIDGWGEDKKVSDSICYRAFIWKVGMPKPGVADDLGCSDYEVILEVAIIEALKLIK